MNEESPSSAAIVLSFGDSLGEIDSTLDACCRAIRTHPIAAQAIFSALAAEGRRYISTEEGRALATRLETSPWLKRARIVWETVSLSAFSEHDSQVLPSACIEAILSAVRSEELEPLLSRIFFGDPP